MTQFCVEEAVFEYVEQREIMRKANVLEEPGGVTPEDPEWQNAMAQAQAFARGKN